MQRRPDHTRCLLDIALAFLLVITVLGFADLMSGRSALQLLGASWEFLGAFTLIFSLLYHHLGLYRMKKRSGLMEPAKDWIRQIPLSFAYDFGPKEPPEGQEDPIDSYATMFWGSALLVVGFLLQVVSQLPWLESNFQAVTQTVSQAPSWKHWAVGLSFAVVGGFIIGPSLHLLRYWRASRRLRGPAFSHGLPGHSKDCFSPL